MIISNSDDTNHHHHDNNMFDSNTNNNNNDNSHNNDNDNTPNLPTSIMDFRGFDSSIILLLRGGIPRPIGNFPEDLSQAILAGAMLVWRLAVLINMLLDNYDMGVTN